MENAVYSLPVCWEATVTLACRNQLQPKYAWKKVKKFFCRAAQSRGWPTANLMQSRVWLVRSLPCASAGRECRKVGMHEVWLMPTEISHKPQEGAGSMSAVTASVNGADWR